MNLFIVLNTKQYIKNVGNKTVDDINKHWRP